MPEYCSHKHDQEKDDQALEPQQISGDSFISMMTQEVRNGKACNTDEGNTQKGFIDVWE
jgi:hypothetical protein